VSQVKTLNMTKTEILCVSAGTANHQAEWEECTVCVWYIWQHGAQWHNHTEPICTNYV